MKIIIFTLKTCPHCTELKNMLKNEKIQYNEIDIEEYPDLWNDIVEYSGQDYLPTLFIGEEHEGRIYTPTNDYNNLEELVKIIQKKLREQ